MAVRAGWACVELRIDDHGPRVEIQFAYANRDAPVADPIAVHR